MTTLLKSPVVLFLSCNNFSLSPLTSDNVLYIRTLKNFRHMNTNQNNAM